MVEVLSIEKKIVEVDGIWGSCLEIFLYADENVGRIAHEGLKMGRVSGGIGGSMFCDDLVDRKEAGRMDFLEEWLRG